MFWSGSSLPDHPTWNAGLGLLERSGELSGLEVHVEACRLGHRLDNRSETGGLAVRRLDDEGHRDGCRHSALRDQLLGLVDVA